MSKEPRRFSREFKLAVLARMEAGENVSALSRELGIRRKPVARFGHQTPVEYSWPKFPL